MENTARKKIHSPKKEITRSITYRLPARVVDEMENEAMQKGISQNVLVRQVLERYLGWDRFAEQLHMIPIPRAILEKLGVDLEGKDITTIVNAIKPVIKEAVLFIKGGYDLKRCIELLEDYMRASGMNSDHRVRGASHDFIIQHDLGMNWSLFTEQLLKEIFNEFLPGQNVRCQTSEKTVIISVALGSDFSEHDY